MSQTYRVYPNVTIGEGAKVGDFAIIGLPVEGEPEGDLETVIGSNAVIGSHSVIYSGVKIDSSFRCGHGVVIGSDCVIGRNCLVGDNSTIRFAILGNDTVVQELVNLGILPASKYDYKGVGKNVDRVTRIGDNSIIRSHTSIYTQTQFGSHFNCGHGVRIRECTIVGCHTTIGTNAQIEGFVEIGDDVIIQTNAHIGQFSRMEDGTYITAGAVLTNTLHPLCPKAKQCLRGVTLRRGAKVGVNVSVMPGVVIAEDALVGAGAVVVEDVAPGDLVVGVPAKRIASVYELSCPYALIDKPYHESEGISDESSTC